MASEPALRHPTIAPSSSSTINNNEVDQTQKKRRRRRGGRKRKSQQVLRQDSSTSPPPAMLPVVFHHLPMNPTTRYPSTLSQRPGPSRFNRPERQPQPVKRGTPESVDDTVPPHPFPVPHAELSSLADLLKQAGYKETRVFTPENEKRKVIKRTFDDNEEEVQALYGAFGLVPNVGNMHARQTITEPSLPLKSSSSLLRSLALKEITGGVDNDSRRAAATGQVNEDNAWWGGGIAAGLSRAAKAVMDITPPSSVPTALETHTNVNKSRDVHATVGLGLALGGQGVRKARSNVELAHRDRDTDRDERQQEDRPPVFQRSKTDEPPERLYREFFVTPPPEIPSFVYDAPPPPALDEAAFGYSPLPEDYEAQCDEDEAVLDIDAFHVGSLGSSRSRSSSRVSTDDDISSDLSRVLGSMSTIDTGGPGARILMDAVDYDEIDSPENASVALPEVDKEEEMEEQEWKYQVQQDWEERDEALEAESEEEAHPGWESDEEVGEEDEEEDDGRPPSPRYREWSVGSERPIPLAQSPRALKYSDRAAKLRTAKSTPALAHKPSWLGSLRAAVLGQPSQTIAPPPIPLAAPMPRGPLRITPATPAAPALVSASPVICDSASNEAEDLPAIPSAISNTVPATRSYVPLRMKSSLAALRSAVGLSDRAVLGNDDTPTLKPRLDWNTQGSQFAGWTWDKNQDGGFASGTEAEVDGLMMGMRVVSGAMIDYSQSFFYKPTTPPYPSTRRRTIDADPAVEEETQSTVGPTPAKESGKLNKRRSVKSLRAALLLPVAPSPVPPVPPIPSVYITCADTSPPRPITPPRVPQPLILAISSPGAWEAGLPPRQLVLEGEEWDAKDGGTPGDWGRKARRPRRLSSKARV